MPDRYASLKQGLVGCWIPSVSGSGLLLPDLSGRGNHGTLTNMGPEDWVSSQYGRAMDFDGTDDFISIGRSLPAGNRTISAWFFRSTTTGRRGIFGTRPTNGTAGYFLSTSVTSAGTLSYQHPGITAVTSAGGIWSANIWNHVAVTLTGLAVNIFLNGRSVHTGTVAALETASTVAWIGAEEGPAPEVFEGQLDDIRLYSRALTEPEIRLLASEPGIGFKPAKKLSRFSTRYTYKPPKAKVFEGVRVRDHDYASLRQGLVGAWCPSLPNGGSGNTLPDQSGRGNHGTLTNMGPEDWVSSGDGRALDFDGSNDEIRLPGTALSLNKMTISVWAFSSNFSQNGFFFEKTTNGDVNTQYSFFLNSPTTIIYRTYGLSTLDTSVNTTTAGVVNNAWNLFTATFDGSVKRIYVNGRLSVTSSALTGTVTANDTGIALIGRHGAPGGYPFSGQLDDIRIYNRALTESEIRLLASRRGIGLQPSPTRLIAREKKTGLRRKILTGQT